MKISHLNAFIGKKQILHDLSLELAPNFYALIGANGAGKSTLLRCLARINTKMNGEIYLKDTNLKTLNAMQRARLIAFMPQFFADSFLSVFDVLSLGQRVFSGTILKATHIEKIEQAAKDFKINDLNARLNTLSGGQRQKVFIVSAILQSPKLLLLDEPVSHLDLKNQHEMLNLIANYTHQNSITTIAVLHDIHHALHYADELIMLKQGKLFARTKSPNEQTLSELFDISLKIHQAQSHSFVYHGDV